MPAEPADWLFAEAVEDALQAIDGTGDYHYDVADAVHYGLYDPSEPPQAAPCVSFMLLETRENDGPDLPGRTVRPTVTVQGWALATADTARERAHAAARLASDVRQALKVAKNYGSASILNTLVIDLEIASNALDGGEVGAPASSGYVALSITGLIHRSYAETE